jgi:hypothetical protein
VRWQIGVQDNVTDDASPNADAQADLIPMFADSVKITRAEATAVDVEHTLTRKTRIVCPQNVVYRDLIRSVMS